MISPHPWLIAACALNVSALSSTAYVALQYTDLNSRIAAIASPNDAAGASGVKPRDERDAVGVSSPMQELDLLKTEMIAAQRKFDDWAAKARQQQNAIEESLRSLQLKAETRSVADDGDGNSLTAAELEYQAQRQAEEYSVKAKDYFQIEPIDLRWSFQMAGLIEEKFTSPELKNAILSDVECRATLCRLNVKLADAQQQADLENSLPMLFAAELPRTALFQEEQTDGSIKTTVYLVREGHDLPW